MRADVLLLRPSGKETDSRLFAMEQLGLSYVASFARANGLSVEIIDGFLDPIRYEQRLSCIADDEYRVIGYPVYEETLRRVAEDVARLRERTRITHVTIGNHLATFRAREILQQFSQFDSAIRGEGEETLTELVKTLSTRADLKSVLGLTYRANGFICENPPRPNWEDLDTLPFPARDTLPLVIKAGNAPLLYSSRGCNARCTFCSVHKFFRSSPNGMWRGRSPGNVVDEMEQLKERFGITEFAFADEQFLGHGVTGTSRAMGIAEEILRRGLRCKWYIETRSSDVSLPLFRILRDSGLHAVFMGMESGFDPALKAFKKGIRASQHLRAIEILQELEILPSVGFIMFRPETTMEELTCNLAFLERIGCGEITGLVTQLKVYAGTDLEGVLGKDARSGQARGWAFVDPQVEQCFHLLMDSADFITASYNEFARVRRMGVLTYSECLDLQRVLNHGPIAAARDILQEIVTRNIPYLELRAAARVQFKTACEDFLRILWLTESLGRTRYTEEGIKLLNPMSLC